MSKAPAFQFYAADFLIDTAEMTGQEVGIYIRLLCYQWVNESLPSDPKRLSSIAIDLLDVWQDISYKFVEGDDGRLRNPRLEETRRVQQEHSEKRRIAGSKGGKAKQANSKKSSNATNLLKQKCSSSSSSSSSVLKQGINEIAWHEYIAYRKDSKLKSLKPASLISQKEWLIAQGDEIHQNKIIQETIRNGWQGLFELKEKSNGQTQQANQPRLSAADRVLAANSDVINS